MHILHVTPYYAPAYAYGGVVRASEGMARALVRREHRVTVLTTDAFDHHNRYTGPPDTLRDGVRVIYVPNLMPALRGRFNLATPRGMRQQAQAVMPDVDIVHCHEFRTVENLLVTPVAAEYKRPIILSPHGTLALSTGRSRLKSGWDSMLSPAVAQRVDHVVALAPPELADVQALWPRFGRRRIPTNFSIIPNGIDPQEYATLPDGRAFRAQYGLGDGPVVLFVGRLHTRKGIEILVRAFNNLSLPEARLLVVGPDEGMMETLRPLISDQMVFTGYLDGEARLAAFAASDMLALPAIGEGLSMAVLEAMGCGLPVVLSPGCNLPEAADYGAGLIVDADVNKLTQALTALLTEPAKRQQMGRAAKQLVIERFTWDAVAKQLEIVYNLYVSKK